ncbi:MAG TPA: hypothetical protein DHW82_03275 [Spirochaetia bacterium]|nr:MAG: hypothetical protein A2Y41_02020 [Spirochaetes bacterium GWB1_36_13]HCL56014.1 hypothetical protein [Spirochaetia bacterium]
MPRKSKKTEIKNSILKEAEKQFFQFGYSKVNIDEIASSVGWSKKTIYTYFESKKSILEQVVDHLLEEAMQVLNEINSSNKNFFLKIKDIWEYINIYRNKSKLMLKDIKKEAPDLFLKINDFSKQFFTTNIKKLIIEGQEKNLIRKDFNMDIMLAILNYLTLNLFIEDIFKDFSFSPEEEFDTLYKIILEGILIRKKIFD